MAGPTTGSGSFHEIMAMSARESFAFDECEAPNNKVPQTCAPRPVTAASSRRDAGRVRTCGKALPARSGADVRGENEGVHGHNFLRPPGHLFRRTGSLQCKMKGDENAVLSWGAGDLASVCDPADLASVGDAAATRKNWRPASAAPGRTCENRATYLPLTDRSAAGAPRPFGPISSRANTRPASARVYIQSDKYQPYMDNTIRPPSAPARPQAHRPSSSKGHSSVREPARSHHICQKSSRRERSFNITNQTLDSQRALQGSTSIGACLPLAWTPPSTPSGQDDELDEVTFARAEKLTDVRLPRRRVFHRHPKNILEDSDHPSNAAQSLDSDEGIQRSASIGSSCSESNRSAGNDPAGRRGNGKKARYGHARKSLFDKNEKLVGMHVKSANLKKGETQVVYSQNYVASKDLEVGEIREKGTGTVIGWDPDGLMTDVQWEDGTTEYCCTGYNRLYYLALKIVVDEETGAAFAMGWEDPAKKMISMMASYPDWLVLGEQENPFPSKEDELGQGVSRVPKTADFRVIKDQWDELSTQRRIQKLKLKSVKEGKDTHVFDKALEISRKNVRQLEKEQNIMSEWIVSNINGVEIRVPPSSLAPPAPVLVTCDSNKRPSLVHQVYSQVRRDAEKARRQARLEREAERERIRLERKAFRVSKKGDPGGLKAKELEEAAAKNKRKTSRLHMDPLEAVLTATEEELDSIFNDTFTLYDFDFSNTMDFAEFEQAMQSMGVKSDSDTLHALVVAMDTDGNGTLDLSEFKTLANQLIATAREVKDDASRKKQLQALNRRRKAAGQAPLARLPERVVGKTKASDETDSGKGDQPAAGMMRDLMMEQFEGKPPHAEQKTPGEQPKNAKQLWKAVFATTVVPQSLMVQHAADGR